MCMTCVCCLVCITNCMLYLSAATRWRINVFILPRPLYLLLICAYTDLNNSSDYNDTVITKAQKNCNTVGNKEATHTDRSKPPACQASGHIATRDTSL